VALPDCGHPPKRVNVQTFRVLEAVRLHRTVMQPGYRIAGVPWRQFNGENTMFKFTGKLLSLSAATLMVTSAISSAQSMDELVAAAKKEGQLTTIALPHDWCGYGAVIDAFKKKYPEITVNELNPDAGSGDEVEAIRANKDNKGAQAPDVIDVGLSFGPSAKAEGLLMPYKVSTWDSIPDSAKDAEGYWYGDYYGVLAFEVNKDLVKDAPKDWADLLKPDYANSVAMAGDPRTSNQAIQAVYAAGLAAGAAAGKDAGTAGLDFFKKLNGGNFVPVIGKSATLAQGQTPILITWDYNALSGRDTLAGNPPVDVIVPASGVVAGVYVQAISAYAPHPNAAKLWMEYLYSDEGQIGWLKGYCHPIRFNDLAKNGKVPQELLDKMPPAESYAKAVFPTLDEQGAAKDEITKNWDSVVGANVK
jgi:putative spermidine/putrescine transport system substrate-binding protein